MTQLSNDKQQELWRGLKNSLLYAELCNALYEREIPRLSDDELTETHRVKWLKSLPFYVRKTAQSIVDSQVPFEFDSQNGSWFEKQASKSPHLGQKAEDIAKFYNRSAPLLALVVPVYTLENGFEKVYLDTVDQIDDAESAIHTNANGWFKVTGEPVASYEQQSALAQPYDNISARNRCIHFQQKLLKPTKLTLKAACCGHQWLNNKRRDPRLLSLREMLLVAKVNWNNLQEPVAAKR